MTASKYNHTFLELQCLIESPTEKTIKIKLPSQTNWTINLQSILKRIPKKFKFLQNMNESQWLLSLDNVIINKQDPLQFGQLLSRIPSPAIIEIIKTANYIQSNMEHNKSIENINNLRINYKSSSILWKPSNPYSDTDEYWHNNYNDLINTIKTYTNFSINTNNFKLMDIDECEIIDGYDLDAIYKSTSTDNQQHIIDVYLTFTPSNDDYINDVTNKIINEMHLDEIHTLQNMMDNDKIDDDDDSKDDEKWNNKHCFNESMDVLDSVHEYIEIAEGIKPIIDTPHFQRLRELKQLGASCYVFPGATHTRFEHSIGVMHLAETLIKAIKSRQPELAIRNTEIFCVSVAGLLHDIGHGPFSHLFDNEFMRSMTNTKFRHEDMSVKIISDLFQYLRKEKNYNINDEELELIQALISPSTHQDIYNKYKSKGRGFLFEIVSNEISSVDVDKWDYFLRDSLQTGVGVSFNRSSVQILVRYARVINDHICFRKKVSKELETMMRTRHELWKKIYSHKAAKGFELLIVDILKNANDAFNIVQKTKILNRFLSLTDSIINIIEFDNNNNNTTKLNKAKQLIHKLRKREKYKCCGDLLIPSEKLAMFNPSKNNDQENKKNEYEYNVHPKIEYRDISRNWELELYEMFEAQILNNNNNKNNISKKRKLEKSDLIVSLISLSFGMETKHPMEQILFYNEENSNKCYHLQCSQVATMSGIFREVVFRIYIKKNEWSGILKKIFNQFVKEKGLDHNNQ